MKTFTYVSPDSVLIFSLFGEDGWTEQDWLDNARIRLDELVLESDSYHLEDTVED